MTIEYAPGPEPVNMYNSNIPTEQELMGSNKELEHSQGLYEGQDMSKIIKVYMEEQVPEAFKMTTLYQEFWAVLGNTIKLTFINSTTDMTEFMLLFDDACITYKMSKPALKYSFTDMQMLDQFRIYFRASLKRAVGMPGYGNERVILGGQIQQLIRTSTENLNAGGGKSGGAFGWLKNGL